MQDNGPSEFSPQSSGGESIGRVLDENSEMQSHSAPPDAASENRSSASQDSKAPPESTSPTSRSPLSYPVGMRQKRASDSQLENQPPTRSRNREPRTASEPVSLGGLYFLLASAALMFGIWFIGPKLVEEYNYAATIGKARAEYDNAVEKLKDQPLANISQAYQLVAQKIRPSVVSVRAIKTTRAPGGLGSGVIMSSDGYIMTNAHVLEGASRFFVELHDRRQYKAVLIGKDAISDLALLKIDAPNLIAANWGDSDASDVGSIVWAIGSPYGFQQTVTSGILSGKDRPGDANHSKQNLLQTDAAVNPGNSGGPLVDSLGRVIGINTSIFGETFQGISFAVPSATAMFVYQKLKEEGKVIRGYLGVRPTAVDSRDARRMNLADLDGAKLLGVVSRPPSPAYKAGLQENDIIRSWNGIEIKEYKTLYRLAEMTEPFSTVDITLIRNGEQLRTQVTLEQFQDLIPAEAVPSSSFQAE